MIFPKKSLFLATPFLCWTSNKSNWANAEAEVGDAYCVEGLIMDNFCIDRGAMLDPAGLDPFTDAEKHTLHCVVDVDMCIESGFVILNDKDETTGNYSVSYPLNQEGMTMMVVAAAKAVGVCERCSGTGTIVAGLRVGVVGTITNNTTKPYMISLTTLEASNGIENYCETKLMALNNVKNDPTGPTDNTTTTKEPKPTSAPSMKEPKPTSAASSDMTSIPLVNAEAEVGDSYCVEGLIMDNFCIDRGAMLDPAGLDPFTDAEKHTLHCVVDVDMCIESGFVILNDKDETTGNYSVSYPLNQEGMTMMVVAAAKAVGVCGRCSGTGTIVAGLRVGVVGTITNNTTKPYTISLTTLEASNGIENYCETKLMALNNVKNDPTGPTDNTTTTKEPKPTSAASSANDMTSIPLVGGVFLTMVNAGVALMLMTI